MLNLVGCSGYQSTPLETSDIYLKRYLQTVPFNGVKPLRAFSLSSFFMDTHPDYAENLSEISSTRTPTPQEIHQCRKYMRARDLSG